MIQFQLWGTVVKLPVGNIRGAACCLSDLSDLSSVLWISWKSIRDRGSERKTWRWHNMEYRADSRFAPSQWETALLCNDVSHWLGASPGIAFRIAGNCCNIRCTSKTHIELKSCKILFAHILYLNCFLALCGWNQPVADEWGPVIWRFDVSFVVPLLNQLLNPQSTCRWLKRHEII